MTRLLFLAFLLIAAFAAAPAAAQEDWTGPWTGPWTGTLSTPSLGALRLVVTVSRRPDGTLAAELESPDQGPGRIPVPQFAIADGVMRFELPAISARYEGRWDSSARRFAGTFTQGMALPLALERGGVAPRAAIAGLDGRWEGSVDRNGTALRLILRVRTAPGGGTFAQLDSPDLLAMNLPVTELARDGQAVSFAVPVGAARFRGTLAPDGSRIAGIWSRTGSADAQTAFVRAAEAPAARARPQAPRPPFPYRTEEVAFDNPGAPGVRLAGTLILPQGEGPFPAAILISGSGPQDRDESLLGHRPFAVLADHLARRGIAVLRYDDRGTAASTGRYDGATAADFASDSNAAFAFLRARREIGPIGFVGHSEGGMIGPIAMQGNDSVAFLVMLAGPGTRISALMESQRRAIGESQGMSAADLERAVPLQDALYAAGAADGDDEAVAARLRSAVTDEMLVAASAGPGQLEALVAQAQNPWFRYFVRYDPAPVLARIRAPVLALNGALDRQVLAAENLAGIRSAMAANPDLTVTELPGLNHLFQTARTGAVGEYADIEETMAPAALEAVSGWIAARFGR